MPPRAPMDGPRLAASRAEQVTEERAASAAAAASSSRQETFAGAQLTDLIARTNH